MRRLALLLSALVAGGCTFTEDTAAPPAELPDFERGARVTEAWSAGTGDAFNRHWVQMRPLAADGVLYTANVAGQVSAFDAASGRRRWRVDVGAWLSAGVGGDAEAIYLGTAAGTLIALDAGDGSERWRRQVGGELLAPPAVADGQVVARTVDGRVLALARDDGNQRWAYSFDVPSLSLRGNGMPVPVGGGVLVGLDNGRVVALDSANGAVVWQTTVAPPEGRSPIERMVDIDGMMGIGRNVLYAVTYQGQIAQIEPRRGNVRWERAMSSYAGLAVDGRRVYVTDADSHVRALEPDSGATLWRQEKLAHRRLTAPIPVPGTDFLVVADFEGYVHVLTRGDGRIVARRLVDTGFGVLADPLPLDEGRVAVQTQGARVRVLEIGAPD